MNIIFLLKTYPAFGGVEKITTILAEYFIGRGHGVHTLSASDNQQVVANVKTNHLKCHVFPNGDIDSADNVDFLLQVIQKEKIDIIINQGIYWDVFELLMKAKHRLLIPVITVFHNAPDCFDRSLKSSLNHGTFYKRLIKWVIWPVFSRYQQYKIKKKAFDLYQLSSSFVLLSDSFKEDFRTLAGIDGEKLVTIPNCFERTDIDLNTVLNHKKKQILYVGRLLNSQKRVDRLIDIWAGLESKYPDWNLVLVGDGEDKGTLQAQCEALGLRNVKFEGYHSQVGSFYESSDIVCLTSDFEGFGMVLIEGMQWGCVPFAYNSYKSLNDIIDDKVNGFVIAAFDQTDYIRKLSLLMDDQQLRSSMAAEAQQKSYQYDIDAIYPEWDKLLISTLRKYK